MLTCMAEGWMPKVVSECRELNEIGVDLVCVVTVLFADQIIQPNCDTLRNLSDLKAVGQPVAKEITFVAREKLRFPLQSAESRRMYYACKIAPKWGAVFLRASRIRDWNHSVDVCGAVKLQLARQRSIRVLYGIIRTGLRNGSFGKLLALHLTNGLNEVITCMT